MLESLQTQLYKLEQFANALVSTQLTHLGWVSIGVIFAAGLLTSLTPCMLSMLPITIGYIGGYDQKAVSSSCPVHLVLFRIGHPGRARNYSSFSRASLWSSRNWFADYCQHRGNSNGTKLVGGTAFPVTILWRFG